jgi:hypothetical protein
VDLLGPSGGETRVLNPFSADQRYQKVEVAVSGQRVAISHYSCH